MKKARVMKKHQIEPAWHEVHFGIMIAQNEWGCQIYDPDSPFGELSPQMLEFAEWFPHNSKCQRVEVIGE